MYIILSSTHSTKNKNILDISRSTEHGWFICDIFTCFPSSSLQLVLFVNMLQVQSTKKYKMGLPHILKNTKSIATFSATLFKINICFLLPLSSFTNEILIILNIFFGMMQASYMVCMNMWTNQRYLQVTDKLSRYTSSSQTR